MPKHIGIVACSAEGAALCYRTICGESAAFLGRHAHPEISLHTFPLAQYMEPIYRNDWDYVAQLMLCSAQKLAAAGADFFICPDNTLHQAFDMAVLRSPRPWLHIAEEVAKEARRQGFRRVGVLGTKYLMEGPVYGSRLSRYGITLWIPAPAQRQRIDQVIFDELVYGRFLPASLDYFNGVIADLKLQGCDAVILGCTEIPLLVVPERSPLPVLDSTRLLARAAIAEALDQRSPGTRP